MSVAEVTPVKPIFLEGPISGGGCCRVRRGDWFWRRGLPESKAWQGPC